MIKVFNKTKIIATVGPSSYDEKILYEMIAAGVDIFRLNFSHGTHEQHLDVINKVRKINAANHTNIGFLADLQGPKIRFGEIENEKVYFKEGALFSITTKMRIGNEKQIYISYKQFPKDVKKGELVLVDDGKMELKVISTNKKDLVRVRVLTAGKIYSNKGVNLPNTKISIPSLTEKDRKDLNFIVKHKINWIGLSFVRSADDIKKLKSIVNKLDRSIKIIAKIEKPEAVENLSSIIRAADGVMVARGDLGVEVPINKLSLIQKDIVKRCIKMAKPVIIATQIMESMISNRKPTRAEINDVANAVFDGADALMLSGETAIGRYPVEVIETIESVLSSVEEEKEIYYKNLYPHPKSRTFLSDAICYNACNIANNVDAEAIIGMTRSGYTAFMISSYRPKSKIFIFTDNQDIVDTMSLVWGVRAFYYDRFVSTDETIHDVHRILKKKGLVHKGDIVINTGNMPITAKGKTNMLKITKIV